MIQQVVGLDLSLTGTGIAVGGGGLGLESVVTQKIGSKPHKSNPDWKDPSWDDRFDRTTLLVNRIANYVPRGSLVLVEAPAYGAKGGSAHDRSGLWWMIFARLTYMGCTVVPTNVATVKTYATGKGNADKDEVLAAVVRRYAEINVTGNDIADAVTLMAIGLRLQGNPCDDLPQTHLRAMAKIKVEYERARHNEALAELRE